MELFLVSRNLERVADLATNVAEDVVFLVEGKSIKHHAEDRGEARASGATGARRSHDRVPLPDGASASPPSTSAPTRSACWWPSTGRDRASRSSTR